MKTRHQYKQGKTWKGATAKGALVWGSLYSTASSGAAYMLAPVMSGSSPGFGDIFMDSLMIFPTAGAAQGLLMWRLRKDKIDQKDELLKYMSKGTPTHKHPIWVHKAH